MLSLGGKMGEEEEEAGVGANGTAAAAASAASMGLTARPRGEKEKIGFKWGRRTLRRRGWKKGALVGCMEKDFNGAGVVVALVAVVVAAVVVGS